MVYAEKCGPFLFLLEGNMPRKPRASAAGVPEHVIQRGNNRQVIFACEDDMKCYQNWLLKIKRL